MVIVRSTWDSGPFSVYYLVDREQSRQSYGDFAARCPCDVWERYKKAEAEFYEAEDALCEALEENAA